MIGLQEIVTQGKALCGQYIRSRLKRAGLFDRKCGLQRLRSAATLPTPQGLALREVFPELNAVGLELERRHPKLYTGVARQAANGPIVSDKAAATALTAVGRYVQLHALHSRLKRLLMLRGHP